MNSTVKGEIPRKEEIERFLSSHARATSLEDVPVSVLRSIIPLLMKVLYYEKDNFTSQKVKGMWDKCPGDWPEGVLFCDPNNGSKNHPDKPKKEELIPMLQYLLDRYKEKQEMESVKWPEQVKDDDKDWNPLTERLQRIQGHLSELNKFRHHADFQLYAARYNKLKADLEQMDCTSIPLLRSALKDLDALQMDVDISLFISIKSTDSFGAGSMETSNESTLQSLEVPVAGQGPEIDQANQLNIDVRVKGPLLGHVDLRSDSSLLSETQDGGVVNDPMWCSSLSVDYNQEKFGASILETGEGAESFVSEIGNIISSEEQSYSLIQEPGGSSLTSSRKRPHPFKDDDYFKMEVTPSDIMPHEEPSLQESKETSDLMISSDVDFVLEWNKNRKEGEPDFKELMDSVLKSLSAADPSFIGDDSVY